MFSILWTTSPPRYHTGLTQMSQQSLQYNLEAPRKERYRKSGVVLSITLRYIGRRVTSSRRFATFHWGFFRRIRQDSDLPQKCSRKKGVKLKRFIRNVVKLLYKERMKYQIQVSLRLIQKVRALEEPKPQWVREKKEPNSLDFYASEPAKAYYYDKRLL